MGLIRSHLEQYELWISLSELITCQMPCMGRSPWDHGVQLHGYQVTMNGEHKRPSRHMWVRHQVKMRLCAWFWTCDLGLSATLVATLSGISKRMFILTSGNLGNHRAEDGGGFAHTIRILGQNTEVIFIALNQIVNGPPRPVAIHRGHLCPPAHATFPLLKDIPG